ncbi:MAG: zinc dependent phospholipase C family protein [Bdellovibrionota bacterium]
MPSGLTHILLAKTFNENTSFKNEDLEDLLAAKNKVFQLGALAPDLAYSQQMPLADLMGDEDECADLFHYERTNQIPLKAFEKIKSLPFGKTKDTLFCFFLGYVAHLVADGIIHPFVRDKVGNYEDNSSDHRALEMRLDAIFLDYITSKYGTSVDLNVAGIQDQIGDVNEADRKIISESFSSLIAEVYTKKIAPKEIVDWVSDLHSIFNTAASKNNCYYAYIPGMKSYLYNDAKKVLSDKERDLWLRVGDAKGRAQNFLGRDVHFLNDCVPQFYRYFGEMALQAYLFCYEDGLPIPADRLEAINLDTGRLLLADGGKDLNSAVAYWGKV